MLKRLRLVNVGVHADRTVEFGRMTVVVGPNGSGKSTVVRALRAIATGDFGGAAAKAQNARQGRPAGAPGYAELEFTAAGGVTAVVRRSVAPPGQWMTLSDGSERLTAGRDVTDRVLDLLGVSAGVLEDFVFADQGRVESVLVGTKAQRSEALARLFGVDRLDRLVDAVQKAAPRAAAGPPGGPARAALAAAEAALVEAEAAAAAVTAGLEKYAGFVDYSAAADPDLALLRRRDDWQAAKSELDRLEAARPAAAAAAASARADAESLAEDLQALRGAVAVSAGEAAAARAALTHWAAFKQAATTRARIDREAEALRLEAVTRTEPARPGHLPTPAEEASMLAAMAEANDLAARMDRVVRAWSTGDADCPHCGRPMGAEHAGVVAGCAAARDTALEAARAAAGRLAAVRAYADAHADWRRWRDDHARRVELNRAAAAAAVATPPAVSEADADRLLADADRLGWELHALEAATRRAADVAAAAERDLAALDDRAAGLAARAGDPVSDAAAEAAARRHLDRTAARREVWRLEAERKAADRDLRAAKAAAAARRADVRAAAAAEYVGATLAAARDTLRAARGAVADRNLARVAAAANGFLAEFEAPFRLAAGPDLQMTASKPDGTTHPAGMLSGGELVVAGISFRLGVNTLFAADAGLLVMDEPTVFLDRDNVRCLHRALERLGRLSRDRNVQVVMVTHEESLVPYFDTVVNLGRA